jgi:hypothetical protein
MHEFDRFNYRRRIVINCKNKFKNFARGNYHFLGYIKKFLLLILAILSHFSPKAALSLALIIFTI